MKSPRIGLLPGYAGPCSDNYTVSRRILGSIFARFQALIGEGCHDREHRGLCLRLLDGPTRIESSARAGLIVGYQLGQNVCIRSRYRAENWRGITTAQRQKSEDQGRTTCKLVFEATDADDGNFQVRFGFFLTRLSATSALVALFPLGRE